jgi:hypothetical protein
LEPPANIKGAKRVSENDFLGETRGEKKARLDAKVWSIGDDPLLRALE